MKSHAETGTGSSNEDEKKGKVETIEEEGGTASSSELELD